MVSAESHVSLPDVAPLSKKPSVVDFHTYPHPCLSHQGKLFSLHKRTTPKGLEYASERGFQGGINHDPVAHEKVQLREHLVFWDQEFPIQTSILRVPRTHTVRGSSTVY